VEILHVSVLLPAQIVPVLIVFPWQRSCTGNRRCKNRSDMHVSIERLYQFVMGLVNLTESEQAHVVRCSFCVMWLDACVEEKVSTLVNAYRS
jgi:hypothetical protein